MVQLPVLLSAMVAEETPLLMDWLPIVQAPVALKFTWSPFGTPPLVAVAVTVGCGPEMMTELGSGPSVMLWSKRCLLVPIT